MSRKTSISVSVLALLVIAGLAWAFRPAAIPVDTGAVTRGPFALHVEEEGVTRVRDRYVVAAPVSGILMRPTLRTGDRVKRGEVVAVIVPNPAQMLDARTRSELAARVEAAAAQVSRIRSLVRQTEAAAFQAETEHRRLEELRAGGYASQTEIERSALTVELRRKDAEAAKFEADAAEHDLEQARAASREGDGVRVGGRVSGAWSVRAPIDGVVLKIHRESESPVLIGGSILELGDVSRLEARIDVLSTEATKIHEQAYVDFRAGDVRLAGRVRRIEPSGYTKVSALGIEEQRVDVLVDFLPNASALERVADGYRVDTAIEVLREEDTLRIPLSALFRHGTQWATFRIENGRAILTPLRIGHRGTELATVLAGVPEGALVIVYPSDAVRDGSRVMRRE
jgi:HlyD family secretion protein